MSERAKISIAMAAYNGERFIREQLESFALQTRLPDELVVSDDASTDRTVEIVRQFTVRAPFPVRVVMNERNLGMTKNFERAISECTGDIIFTSDWDDVWYREKIRTMEEAFERWPTAGLAVSKLDFVDADLRPIKLRLRWFLRELAYRPWSSRKSFARGKSFNHYFLPQGCTMAFRSKFKDLVLPLPDHADFERRGGTWDFFIGWCICASGAGAVLIPEALMAYRRHPKALTWGERLSRREQLRWWRARLRGDYLSATIEATIERMESPVAAAFCTNQRLRNALIQHWRARTTLPAQGLARLSVVFRELLSLRYHRFSSGLLTAAKDLLFAE